MEDLEINYLANEFDTKVKNDLSIFNFIINDVLDGVWFWDLENPEHEWMSPKYWELIGYSPTERPSTPEAWQVIMHSDDLALAQDLLKKHLDNPAIPYDQTVRFIHKTGKIIWIRCRAQALPDEHGKLTRMFGAHFKTTALVFKNDEQIEFNKSNQYSLIEALQKDEFRKQPDVYLENLLQQSRTNYSIDKRFVSNKIRNTNFRYFYPEHLVGFIEGDSFRRKKIESIVQNISSHAELHNQLNSRNFLLDYFKQNSKDGLIIFNNRLEAIYINEAVGNLIRVKFEAYPVSLSQTIQFFHSDDLNELFKVTSDALERKLPKITTQHRANSLNKGIVWIESNISFTYDEFGALDKAFVVSRDITSTKELEEKLQYVSKRRKEIAEQLIEEKEKNKEELYNELHDGINQLLFAAKLNIQNSGIKDVLLDNAQEKLKLAIEHIRKIALESTTQFVFNDNFLTTITDYVLGFNSESTTKFRIDTEIQEPLIVNNLCKKHIFRIIQRLVHFSINTSKSKNCSIRFKQIKNDFVIIAVDNGFFNFDFPTRSHDLKSIQDRIYLIEGQIRFFNFSNQGLAVHIKIKLHE